MALEEGASAEITVGSYAYDVAYDGQVLVSAAAIHADKELQLNTTGYLFIDASNVDVANGRKGLGIDARNTLIDNVGQMEITYPANTRNACNHAPIYDPQRFIFLVFDYGMRSFVKNGVAVSVHPVRHLLVEPGYPVHFDVAEGGTLNVESVYQNAAGDYLVRPGDDLVFYTAPAQISGTAASWNDVDDAVYLLCSSAVSDADILAAWESGSYAALPGAAVPAEKGGISAAAVDGRAMFVQTFSFSGVAEGEYKLAVCKPGHHPLITAVTVAGDTALGTLRLTLRGDVNEDGQADLADVRLLFRAASGAETASGPAADENGDGRVNNRDAILLFRRIVS